MARLVPLTSPLEGPVSLSALRNYLRVDGSDDDEVLGAVLKAARQTVARRCGRILAIEIWRVILDAWPESQRVVLPIIPFRRLVAARLYDGKGVASAIPPTAIAILAQGEPPVLSFSGVASPGVETGGIEIDVECGYSMAADVPAALTLAVLRLAAKLYEHRGDENEATHDAALDALIAPYRTVRLA
jgi:uncharacterized phiE125 gp8 family phage protein